MNTKFVVDKKEYRIEPDGVLVYRIRALKDFYTNTGPVKAGDLGGFVENECNLDYNRSCWLYGDSVVRDNACVCGDAAVIDSYIDKSAVVADLSIVAGSFVTDNVVVSGRASVLGSMLTGNAVVGGPTKLYKSNVSGNSCLIDKKCIERATIEDYVGAYSVIDPDKEVRRTYKYTLIPLSGELEGLFRVISNVELLNYCSNYPNRTIPAGTLGGIVSGAHNLSRYGSCWIDKDACVLGNASVYDYAYITGKSVLRGNAVACSSAHIEDSLISENAYISGHSKLKGVHLKGNSRIFVSAKLKSHTEDVEAQFDKENEFGDIRILTNKDLAMYKARELERN